MRLRVANTRLWVWRGLQASRGLLAALALAAVLAACVWLPPSAAPSPACALLRRQAAADSAGPADGAAWPTAGDSVHVVYTSNGAPYTNYQTLMLYGTFKLAQRMPGGDKMVGFTRILHRTAHDGLSPVVPTWRANPLHPECDGAAPRANQPCKYVVADRPNAVRQFVEAARTNPTLIKGAWLYLIETDVLFLRPVAAPGPAEAVDVRPLGFLFVYIAPRLPSVEALMRRLYPPGMGPLTDIPRTGPAPVMARPAEWLRVAPRWEGLSAQIEADPEAVQQLGWMREMYAFSVAAAVERLPLQLAEAPNSTLIIQPPVDLTLGQATQIHYTWGPKLLLASNGSKVWQFEKRDWVGPRFEAELPKPELPPPWEEGRYLMPSALVGLKGAPVTQQHHETILLEVEMARRGIQEVGGARWKAVLGAQAVASGAAALMASRP